MTVDDDSGFSALFFSAIAKLSGRLEAHDIAVYDFTYSYLSFGSWTLVAGSRHRRLRVQFDGKEDHIEIAESTFSDSQSQSEWRMLPPPTLNVGAGVNPSELFDLVEGVVVEAFSNEKEGL